MTIIDLKVSSDLLKTDHGLSDLEIIQHIEHVLSKGSKTFKQIEKESSTSPYSILDTALHYYAFFGKEKIVEYLIENQKADIFLQDDNGNTIMHSLAKLSFHIDNDEKLKSYQFMTDFLLSKYNLLLKNKSQQSMIDVFNQSTQKQTLSQYSYYSNTPLNRDYSFYLKSIFEKSYLNNILTNDVDEKTSGNQKI